MATYYTNWVKSNSSSPNGETYTIDGKQVTYYNDVRFKFITTETLDRANNRSLIKISKYACFYYTWGDATNPNLNMTLSSRVNSQSTQSGTKNVLGTTNQAYTLVDTDSFYVTHNADGSGSYSFTGTGKYTGGSGTTYTKSVSKSGIALTKINRTSTITTTAVQGAGLEFGQPINFSIVNQDSNFTNKLTYVSNNVTYTIGTNVKTSVDYTFSETLVSNYTNSVENAINVLCETYSGSTLVGTTSVNAYVNVPSSYVPSLNVTLEETNSKVKSMNLDAYVQGKSQIKGSVYAYGSSGSLIKNYISTVNNEAFTTSVWTTNLLTNVGSENDVICKVIDSRGRETTNLQSYDVLEYTSPTIVNATLQRCDSDGNLNNEGTCAILKVSYSISPLNNKNAKKIIIVQGTDKQEQTLDAYNGVFQSKIFSNLSTNATYNFNIQLVDSLETTTAIESLPPSFVTRSYLAGGKGISFGQIATKEGFHSYMDSEFHKELKAKNININRFKISKVQGIYIGYIEE